MTNLNLQTIKNEIDRLSLAEKLELIAYIVKTEQKPPLLSAENKAIERLSDLDKPDQWIFKRGNSRPVCPWEIVLV